MPREVFLQLVPARARVVATRTLERLLLEMYPFVPHQVRFLHKPAAANSTRMRPDAVVRLRMTQQLVLLRCRVFAMRKGTAIYVAS